MRRILLALAVVLCCSRVDAAAGDDLAAKDLQLVSIENSIATAGDPSSLRAAYWRDLARFQARTARRMIQRHQLSEAQGGTYVAVWPTSGDATTVTVSDPIHNAITIAEDFYNRSIAGYPVGLGYWPENPQPRTSGLYFQTLPRPFFWPMGVWPIGSFD